MIVVNKIGSREGRGFDLYSLVDDQGQIDILRKFIETLSEQDRIQVLATLNLLRCAGDPHNTQKFRKLKGSEEIYEVKTRNIRIMCFKCEPDSEIEVSSFLRNSLILLHGYEKHELKKKRLARAVNKAENVRKEYFNGHVRIVEI